MYIPCACDLLISEMQIFALLNLNLETNRYLTGPTLRSSRSNVFAQDGTTMSES